MVSPAYYIFPSPIEKESREKKSREKCIVVVHSSEPHREDSWRTSKFRTKTGSHREMDESQVIGQWEPV